MSQSVSVGSFGSVIEAEIAKSVLEANGVKAVVMADDAGGMLPPLGGGVRLVVLEEDAELARQILEASCEPPTEDSTGDKTQ